MVICTFFLNNNCRFGNQCKKEHLDVRLIVKTDVDSVVKGNQWPLSTYGPFKDVPSIPHFIEDQSFEELRAAAYEAKTNGSFGTVASQVVQRFADAKHRMGQLYEMNHDTLKVIVDLYNTNSTESGGQGTTSFSNPNNPFSKVNSTSNAFGAKPANQANPFASNAGSNIFGSAPSSVQSSSIFGGQSNETNVFGGNTTAFGSTTNTSSVFGGGSSVFGGSSNNTVSSGIFSQTSQTANPIQPTTTNNIFGSSSFGAPASGGSIFGGAASFSSQPSGIFGGNSQPATSTSIFGQSTTVFGGAAPATNANVFGAPASNSSNLFGAPSQQPSIFGAQVADATPQNPFGTAPSMFGAPQQQQQAPTSIFGPTTAPAASNNIFGASNVQPPPAFGAPTQAPVFGQTTTQPPAAFGTATQPESRADGVAFGNNYQSPFGASQAQTTQQSAFGGGTAAAANTFGNQPTLQTGAHDVHSTDAYSALESLSEADLAAFNASTFELASIPTRPPPRQLCI